MKAVKKFKALIHKKRPEAFAGTLGKGIRTIHSSGGVVTSEPALHKSRSVDIHDRRTVEAALAAEGIHHGGRHSDPVDPSVTMIDAHSQVVQDQELSHQKGQKASSGEFQDLEHPDWHWESSGDKGHAHDPLAEEHLFLGIGTGGYDDTLEIPQNEIVAESPTAAEFSIYDLAYQQEVERIRASQGHHATVYLTRRVDGKKEYKADENMVWNISLRKFKLPLEGS